VNSQLTQLNAKVICYADKISKKLEKRWRSSNQLLTIRWAKPCYDIEFMFYQRDLIYGASSLANRLSSWAISRIAGQPRWHLPFCTGKSLISCPIYLNHILPKMGMLIVGEEVGVEN
jgi:hypothetical protein